MDIASSVCGERIFITGGAGFIGSTLAGLLVGNNEVVIYDDLSRNALASKPFSGHPNLTLIKGDVLNPEHLQKAMEGSTYVIHCAGIAGIDTVVKSPVRTLRVNIIGSANLLEAVRSLVNCKRVICFSTSEVFGQMAFRSEETSPATLGAVGEARWTYAVSKLAEEHLAYAYFKDYGLPTVSVRPFNVYGPGQVGEGALRTFVLRALRDETIYIHGDGTQIRSWCYVDDMVKGILLCMVKDAAIGESFNIGNQRAVITIYGLASTVIRVIGSRSKIEFQPKPAADIELRIPSVEKAKKLLDFEAQVGLDEGILNTADFFRRAL